MQKRLWKEESFEQGILCLSTFLADMMEKYRVQVLREIAVEIHYEPETWCYDAEGKRLQYEAYAKGFLKQFEKVA